MTKMTSIVYILQFAGFVGTVSKLRFEADNTVAQICPYNFDVMAKEMCRPQIVCMVT